MINEVKSFIIDKLLKEKPEDFSEKTAEAIIATERFDAVSEVYEYILKLEQANKDRG